MNTILIWTIAGATIAGILFRPRGWPEAVWACMGTLLLVAMRLIPASQAAAAIARGTDVYLFLTGMMLLSELARRVGVFDWLAGHAVAAAKGSPERLFTLVYLVGIFVTIFLSNDATAVVLTPAVYAAVRKSGAKALPYLLICAFIANAASFVLPISNPANLVVYGKNLPALLPWLRTFLAPSLCAIATTYLALRWLVRGELKGAVQAGGEPINLSKEGRLAAWAIAGTAAILMGASARGSDLGWPTCAAAVLAVLLVTRFKPQAVTQLLGGVSWSVLPLVAALFVLVEAVSRAGALHALGTALAWCMRMPRVPAALAASFGVAGLSNIVNNLPSGLLTEGTLHATKVPGYLRDAVLIGVDLGPNLSVSGSLATLLWLIALRREGEKIDGWTFFKAGLMVMPPALLLATIAVASLSR